VLSTLKSATALAVVASLSALYPRGIHAPFNLKF
jgi:hypothetical protein